MPHKILFVEDDPDFNELTTEDLENQGYVVRSLKDGSRFFEEFNEFEPDLVLLDWQLPGKSGIEIAKELKGDVATKSVPVILMSSQFTEDTAYYEAMITTGADDFIDKMDAKNRLLPSIRVMIARRLITEPNKILRIGPLRIDLDAHEVKRDEEKLSLTPLEFNLLCTLAAKPNLVFSREMLLDLVWGYQYKADTRLVNVHIQRLRSKIEEDAENPKYVLTVRGAGYKAGQS